MTIGAIFLRVDDANLLLVVALVILAGGIIAYLDGRRARRKPQSDQESPRRAA